MSCMVLAAPQAAMATTQLVRATGFENVSSGDVECIAKRKQPLRMNWVVVTGDNGKRHLRMRWTAQQEDAC